MRNDADDKIIIKRESDGHYVYFNVRDDADNGTIIDFVLRRRSRSSGGVRKELRSRRIAWLEASQVDDPQKTDGATSCSHSTSKHQQR